MLLGLRNKTKKSAAFHVEFIIDVQEISPWPPSESLKSLRSVVLFWENGDRNSGKTSTVAPSVGSGSVPGKIEFNESIHIQANFQKEVSSKSGKWQKNVLELNLYEPRREKLKGQHLGTATVDLAEHAMFQEAASVPVPLNSKRSLKNNAQPMLYLKIQPLDGDSSSVSPRDALSKEASIDKDGKESISALMSEEYAEEAEIASFTDDDEEPSNSSPLDKSAGTASDEAQEYPKGAQESRVLDNEGTSPGFVSQPEKEFKSPTIASRLNGAAIAGTGGLTQDVKEKKIQVRSEEVQKYPIEFHKTNGHTDILPLASDATEEQTPPIPPQNALRTGRKMSFAYGTTNSNQRYFGERAYSTLNSDRGKNVRFSMRVPDVDGSTVNKRIDQQKEDVKEIYSHEFLSNPETKANGDDIVHDQEPIRISNNRNDGKVRELELRVELLEAELREAAAAEIGLYSVIAEHGSSGHKVHTPARRLSRHFIHALRHWSKEKMASAARSASSGIVLVAKACGNDVARLSFWFSNCVVLRAIIAEASKKLHTANGTNSVDKNSKTTPQRTSASMWESLNRKKGKLLSRGFDNWEDVDTFVAALKKIESWIFSRIVESIWWQTFTPNMQSARKSTESKASSTTKRSYGRITVVGNQQQATLSIDIWKKAFKEASERLCPVRAAGHECGCLPMLAKLVMEQCIARLDVAMFNAILRESDDEIPTDPTSDPITDPKVLPIPSGRFSFGAGVQLKNAIGSWSRWLTDLFGMDMEECPEIEDVNGKDGAAESLKPFYLLNALSDLLMLPKDMLLESTTRKELCPTFGSSIIKQILEGFVPDEFCPDPIPESVLQALESEDHLESSDKSIRVVPCNASPISYSHPPVAVVLSTIGEVQNRNLQKGGSSVIRKSNTSDDELDELSSPLTFISSVASDPLAKLKRISKTHTRRYRLLHEVWKVDG